MDAANVDLKGFTDRFYEKICGGTLGAVLDTLKYIRHETKTWLEITTLLIPGENDSAEEIDRLSQWVVRELGPDVPLHFTAFHPDWKMLDKPRTPPATLRRAWDIAKKNGVRYAFVGNVHDAAAESTYCHSCNAQLLERDWYELGVWAMTDDGGCLACGAKCAGVFEGPGDDLDRPRQPLGDVGFGGHRAARAGNHRHCSRATDGPDERVEIVDRQAGARRGAGSGPRRDCRSQ